MVFGNFRSYSTGTSVVSLKYFVVATGGAAMKDRNELKGSGFGCLENTSQ